MKATKTAKKTTVTATATTEKIVSQSYKLMSLSKALLGKSTFEKTAEGFKPRAYAVIEELEALDAKDIKALIATTIKDALAFAKEYEAKKAEKEATKTATVKKTVISSGGKVTYTKEQAEAILKALLG